jgi:hypothetical protein
MKEGLYTPSLTLSTIYVYHPFPYPLVYACVEWGSTWLLREVCVTTCGLLMDVYHVRESPGADDSPPHLTMGDFTNARRDYAENANFVVTRLCRVLCDFTFENPMNNPENL